VQSTPLSTRLVAHGPARVVAPGVIGAQRPLATATKSTSPPPSTTTFPASFVPFKSTAPELIPESLGPPIRPRDLLKLACQRSSPLVCPNQRLIEELAVIWHFRRIAGEPGVVMDRHDLAFQKAISSIKALPTKILNEADAAGLPYVGPKIGTLVAEWIETGKIEQARTFLPSRGPDHHRKLQLTFRLFRLAGVSSEELRQDDRLRACILFQTLHSVGPLRARELYDERGCRSLDDVYAVMPETQLEVDHWEELTTSIPRTEVAEIAQTIARELEQISPGCELTVCGGYRRGKPSSGDVDLVFTHRTNPGAITLAQLNRLVDSLLKSGLITGELPGGTHAAGSRLWQKYLVFRLPSEDGAPKRLRRRVDVVFAREQSGRSVSLARFPERLLTSDGPPAPAAFENYATAVLGWTGSLSFERSLRDRAKQLKMKFDSSALKDPTAGARLLDVDPAGGERALFEKFKLDWIEPEFRNADI